MVEWEFLKRDVGAWILHTARSVGGFAAAESSTVTKNILLVLLNGLLTFALVFVTPIIFWKTPVIPGICRGLLTDYIRM